MHDLFVLVKLAYYVEKRTFHPINFFCEEGRHSKRERTEIIDLHLKHVFAECYY